ncbi:MULTISPECIES: hypothetical protein [unclassified Streptomyces]|uniref:hypothetical protein n=1 Tax=unclassified Streptomyces TaxID=2593676 RepID=UPI002552F574|nr:MULTISPECIES: hypothetical protein [unclassified Streptomyces]WRZ62701.1 hypothetical protein OG408_01900 [Streptomyces sp. NBC_01257]WSU56664.1 hypothetical protein OG450_01865 [Streptomyces sp. NBC_01104]
MTKVLLSLHVLAAILTIGPITVAASMFPRYARQSAGGDARESDGGTAAFLHRLCRGYAVVGIAVPVLGVATGARMGVLADAWLLTSIALTAAAGALLITVVLPGQARLLGQPAEAAPELRPAAARLSMTTGMFNLLWAAVVVLMIVRPGSTTGA